MQLTFGQQVIENASGVLAFFVLYSRKEIVFAEQRNAGYAVFAVVDMLLIFVFRSFSGASNVVISPLRGKKQKGKIPAARMSFLP